MLAETFYNVSFLFQVFHLFQSDAIMANALYSNENRVFCLVTKFREVLLKRWNTSPRVHFRSFTFPFTPLTGSSLELLHNFKALKWWLADCIASQTCALGRMPTTFQFL